MAFDILVLLVVAFVVFQRLWRILGSGENTPPKVKTKGKLNLHPKNLEEVIDIIKAGKLEEAGLLTDGGEIIPLEHEDIEEPDRTLFRIPAFNRVNFVSSARRAFEMITTAFNKGDYDTIKLLTEPKLAQQLKQAIDQRKADGLTVETEFIGFEEIIITEAVVKEKTAEITVKFCSQQVNVLRNASGEVVKGDENYIQNIVDVWTFAKSLDPKEKVWLLKSTAKDSSKNA
ncbi:MAG: Tim44 domain-containing protein [Alphaproteobacteria bacterium]|nr:Tim44 domain-containing protein [Alphaproteobacteria bacterium]